MIAIIRQAQGKTLDVQDLFFRFALDSATDFLLGSSVHSLNLPQVEFAEAFAIVQKTHNDMERLGYVTYSKRMTFEW